MTKCEWCPPENRAEAEIVVNMDGNWLPTRVCRECLRIEQEHHLDTGRGGYWAEMCRTCGGRGDLGDDFSPCPDCDGGGLVED